MPGQNQDWQSISMGVRNALRVPRSALFESVELNPLSLEESVDTPYLGWVGPKFAGTVVVGKNPGGGGDAEKATKPEDQAVGEAIRALRDAKATEAHARLCSLYTAYALQAPTIGMGTLLGKVLEALGSEREEIAFLNLCPFRTRNNRDPKASTRAKSIELVFSPLLKALNPHTVVLLGGFAGAAARHVECSFRYMIPRAINDKQLHPKAHPILAQMRTDQSERARMVAEYTA